MESGMDSQLYALKPISSSLHIFITEWTQHMTTLVYSLLEQESQLTSIFAPLVRWPNVDNPAVCSLSLCILNKRRKKKKMDEISSSYCRRVIYSSQCLVVGKSVKEQPFHVAVTLQTNLFFKKKVSNRFLVWMWHCTDGPDGLQTLDSRLQAMHVNHLDKGISSWSGGQGSRWLWLHKAKNKGTFYCLYKFLSCFCLFNISYYMISDRHIKQHLFSNSDVSFQLRCREKPLDLLFFLLNTSPL